MRIVVSHGRSVEDTNIEMPASSPVQFQQRLGYRFRDEQLLRRALVHNSYTNEAAEPNVESNERLEFLGDAVLGAVVARELFHRFPLASEGWMTVARSQLVRNSTLGEIARSLELGAALQMGAGAAMVDARKQTKVLSRSLEAVIGAVWLDGGDSAADRLVRQLLSDRIAQLAHDQSYRDAKSELQELAQSTDRAKLEYEIVDQFGPVHERTFRAEVRMGEDRVATGEGKSKRQAEQIAAQSLLDRLKASTD